jgi:hypothetical protein
VNEQPEMPPHETQAVVSELKAGLDEAKKLVERTRSLLSGETAYDEGEMAMIAAEAQAAGGAPGAARGEAAVDRPAESP